MSVAGNYKSIVYSVRFGVLGHIGGKLAFVVALLCLPPLLVALYFGEYDYLPAALPVILTLVVLAWISRFLPKPRHLLRSEGYLLTCATFILTPLVVGFTLAPSGLPLVDRLFESISGITTTGLSTVADIGAMDKTFLFTRAWMQWYGGLGIVVLSVTLLMSRSLASSQLLDLPEGADFVSAATIYAQRLFKIYLLLTALVVALSWWSLGNGFDALLLGMSAISTGGFAPASDSLAQLPFGSQLVILGASTAGAIALPIYLRLQRGAWRQVIDNSELRTYLVLMIICCALLSWLITRQLHSVENGTRFGIIMGLSAMSTTGFANTSIQTLGNAAKLVMIMAMFIGGCLGSTAGGFKIFRLQVLGQLLMTTLRRASAPAHAVIEPRLQGRPITGDQIQTALLTGSLMIVVVIVSWLVFLCYGYDALDSLFEVVSAVGTVGLSSGVVTPDMPTTLKLLLCVDMIAGRVEVLALVCLFYPGLWLGTRNPEL